MHIEKEYCLNSLITLGSKVHEVSITTSSNLTLLSRDEDSRSQKCISFAFVVN